MDLSNEYIELKAQAKVGEPFVATLTQALAKELLNRSQELRPPNWVWVQRFTDIFRAGTYDVNKPDSSPIVILLENDSLIGGFHRFRGFVRSKVKEVQMKFLFEASADKAIEHNKLIWSPELSMKWMRLEKEIHNVTEAKRKKN